MSRLACKWKAKTFAKDDSRLASPYYPSSEAAPPVFTYFQWLQLAEKVLSQFFLANVTLWGSHANAAWVARPSYKHYSSLSQLSSFSSFLYRSRPTRQQLPALCIAARSFVHRLSSLQQQQQQLSNNCGSAKFSLFSWLLCVQHRCNSSVISSINGSGDAWLAGQQSYSSGFIATACRQPAEGKPSFDYYSCFGNSNSR